MSQRCEHEVWIGDYCYKCGELPKKPESPSPLVIAADQLAQAAEKYSDAMVGYTHTGTELQTLHRELRTTLANYKRVREG